MTRLSGGLIDRNRSLNFTFDGKSYTGHAGDTLASALLANDVRLMGRGFKYHRPRGVFTAGSEEPNALVELRAGNRQEPNTRATVAELFEGLDARSQNHVGSLGFDLLAVNDLMSPFFAAGFYYKTFMWPKAFWEKLYEPMIRRAAGLGSLSMQADPDSYDAGFLHCDLLVIGGGAAGLAAALTAARTGARVILADEDFRLGGRLLAESAPLDRPAAEWIAEVEAEFASLPNLRVMRRTTVWGAFDHGIYGAVERVSDHLPTPGKRVRQSLWRITAKRAILAAGATERHIPFANNDRPGVMMAGAMRAYANRWAVSPAKRVAIFTNNDDGHRTAADLAAKGVEIAAVVDSRPDAPARGSYRTIAGGMVTDSKGRLGLAKVEVTQNGRAEWIDCGALGVSGGWNPNLHIASHHRGRPVWNEAAQAFLAEDGNVAGLSIAGAAAGKGSTAQALASGAQAAVAALADIGISAHLPDLPRAEDEALNLKPLWHVPGKGRAWVDFQNDVTVKDVKLAYVENLRPVEHLKRWTTLGMATDQGRTSGVNGMAIMARLTGKSIPETGITTARPPYTPVSLGALAGEHRGKHFKPFRLTPSHNWAKSQNAVFVEAGLWLRSLYFPKPFEKDSLTSVIREVNGVRNGVGFCDVSTLGKVEVHGADAGKFLDRVYINMMSTLQVGKARYGAMLREDGIMMDDGTAARFAEDRYFVTTTTVNAIKVVQHLELCKQWHWPDLDVQIIPSTDQWAQYSVAGPRARELISRIVDKPYDVSNEGLPYMGVAEITALGGLKARIYRLSFSGELAYEIAVPARHGDLLARSLMEKGADLGVTPYGTEALGVMRIEKGHVGGPEINGMTTAADVGLGKMASKKKDYIGRTLSERSGLTDADRPRLIGFRPVDRAERLRAGAHFVNRNAEPTAANDQGYLTSVAYSPSNGHWIGLGFLKNAESRMGEIVRAYDPVRGGDILVEVVSPIFVDSEGARLRV